MAESLALQRIEQLLDEGSFVELGAQVTARITDFTLKSQMEASDGVITGYGQIDGNPVFIYSQNREVLGGTMGEMHAKKIADLYDKAQKTGAPVIGLLDCGGFRLQESVDALDGFGKVLAKQMECSGEVLQICGILGTCAGGMTMIASLNDFAFMAKDAQMFVNAPHTITDNPKLARGFEAGKYQNEISGQAEVLDTEAEVLDKIHDLVLMLTDEEYGCCDEAELNRYVSAKTIDKKDARALLSEISDKQMFTEIRPAYYPEMVTGFLKLNGMLIGAVGNAKALYDDNGNEIETYPEGLTAGGCEKAAQFVEFCNIWDIPVLSVTAADGFDASEATEIGMTKALAKLLKEFADPYNTSVNLIMDDTYGSAYVAMNAKSIGAAMVLAWDDVKVGMMEAEKAANILFADEESAKRYEQAAAYEKAQNSVWSSAARGSVDVVIEPKDTRKHLIMAFSML